MMRNGEAAAGGRQHGRRMIFTGPDGIGDYRSRSNYSPTSGASSPEATGDLGYLCRAAPQAPPPLPRRSCVGEVGWGWQHNQLLNSGALLSNMQIKKTELRTALEDGVTHRFQSDQENMTDDSLQVNTKLHRRSQS
ncbi:protein SPMIP2 [Cebidichthys violaceus]|uniref:protein SPMIP2 n=1 Tax=Cebidichthys violaceus TaxID=271503 RepID=UPI0035CC15FA